MKSDLGYFKLIYVGKRFLDNVYKFSFQHKLFKIRYFAVVVLSFMWEKSGSELSIELEWNFKRGSAYKLGSVRLRGVFTRISILES